MRLTAAVPQSMVSIISFGFNLECADCSSILHITSDYIHQDATYRQFAVPSSKSTVGATRCHSRRPLRSSSGSKPTIITPQWGDPPQRAPECARPTACEHSGAHTASQQPATDGAAAPHRSVALHSCEELAQTGFLNGILTSAQQGTR